MLGSDGRGPRTSSIEKAQADIDAFICDINRLKHDRDVKQGICSANG